MKKIKTIGIFCVILSVIICAALYTIKISSGKGSAGKTIRLGYAQVREYSSFAQQLLMLAEELEDEGSIKKGFSEKYKGVDYDRKFSEGDAKILWDDICRNNTQNAKYKFVRDAFFDMDKMSEKEYSKMVNRDDVDITFAMGTAAGVYFKENETKNKYMVLLAADPIASGIVESETKRYNNNSFALIDNTTYMRQIEAGYKLLKFKKLGVVYEYSDGAYEYSAIDSILKESEKLGFRYMTENVVEPKSQDDYDRYYRDLKKAYKKLIKRGMDTLYITVSSIDYPAKLQELLNDSVIPNKIPTLAQDDVSPVVSGALFGVSLVDYAEQANHVITQLRNYAEKGISFDKLDMVCECTPKIFANYTTAKKIGFKLDFQDLQVIDTVYR